MTTYGVLTSSTNTGTDAELKYTFAAPMNVISNQPAFASDSISLKRLVSSFNVQRWEIETGIAISKNSDLAAELMVHGLVNGYGTNIYVRMPQIFRPAAYKTTTGLTLTVTGINAIGVSSIDISGLSGNTIKRGEFIKFAADPKIYIVTVPTTGSAVGIFPPLRVATTAGEAIAYGDVGVTMLAKYDDKTGMGIKYRDGILTDPGSIKLIEST